MCITLNFPVVHVAELHQKKTDSSGHAQTDGEAEDTAARMAARALGKVLFLAALVGLLKLGPPELVAELIYGAASLCFGGLLRWNQDASDMGTCRAC